MQFPPSRSAESVSRQPPAAARGPATHGDGLGRVHRREKGRARAGCGGARLGGRVGRPHAAAAGSLHRAGDCSLAGSSTSSSSTAETRGCTSSCAQELVRCATLSSARGESCQTQARLVLWRRSEREQAVPDGLALREAEEVWRAAQAAQRLRALRVAAEEAGLRLRAQPGRRAARPRPGEPPALACCPACVR